MSTINLLGILHLVAQHLLTSVKSAFENYSDVAHRQPKLNIREPLNYKDLYTMDLCKMVETNIVLSIKST